MASLKKPLSSDLISYVRDRLAPLSLTHRRVVVGLSGGLDSVVLTHILSRLTPDLGYHLSALHINHQLSPNAGDWQRFSLSLARQLHIPFEAQRVDVRTDAGTSIEAAARAVRYGVFNVLPADYIVLGHHLDDQAETFFLQLLRGAGDRGLAAMPLLRSGIAHGPQYLRPLLEVSRAELHAYGLAEKLSWIEDESNQNIIYARNFLRHKVLPVLEKRFPAYRKTIYRVTRHLAESAQLLDELAAHDLTNALNEDKTLSVAYLRTLGVARAKNLLRAYLDSQNAPPPPAARLEQIHKQILARADAHIELTMGAYTLRRFNDALYVEPTLTPWTHCLEWRGESELPISPLGGALVFQEIPGQGLSLDRLLAQPVTICSRLGGEKLKPDCARPRRSLKNLLQEARVPPWRRAYLPLIYSGKELAAVVGIGVDCQFKARAGEAGLLVSWKTNRP